MFAKRAQINHVLFLNENLSKEQGQPSWRGQVRYSYAINSKLIVCSCTNLFRYRFVALTRPLGTYSANKHRSEGITVPILMLPKYKKNKEGMHAHR